MQIKGCLDCGSIDAEEMYCSNCYSTNLVNFDAALYLATEYLKEHPEIDLDDVYATFEELINE